MNYSVTVNGPPQICALVCLGQPNICKVIALLTSVISFTGLPHTAGLLNTDLHSGGGPSNGNESSLSLNVVYTILGH